jgi:hypothetical protein
VTTFIMLMLASAAPAAEKSPAPTFSKDVAPIFYQQCVSCHRPGEAAPFSLLTYKDAKKRGTLIASVTESRQMPPWKADKSDVKLRNARVLSEAQIDVVQRWVKADMPEGDAKDLPRAPEFAGGWSLGKPDLVVKMPKGYDVAAEGKDVYRNFVIPLDLKEDKYVRAIDFRPSARSVVHHSLFFLDTTGDARKREQASGGVGFGGSMGVGGGRLGALRGLGSLSGEGGPKSASFSLGGWALGASGRELPKGLAYSVPKNADLVLSTHFHPAGKAEKEASTVALYFTDKAPTQRFTGIQLPFGFGILAGIDIPAGKKDFTIEDSYELPIDVKAFGISAHAHYLAKSFTVTATPPQGKTKTLLSITDWDFAWQEQYQFAEFEPLAKGTKIHVKITYDNSSDNPRNPNAKSPKRVRWGRESTDEMGSITLQVVAAKESEFPKLQEAYGKHVRDSVTKSPLAKKLLDRKKD